MTLVYSTDSHGNDFRREPSHMTREQVIAAGRRPFVIPEPGDSND